MLYTYSWENNSDSVISNEKNPILSPRITTAYKLLQLADSTGCTVSDRTYINVIKIDSIITLNNPYDSLQTYTLTHFTDTIQRWFKFTSDSNNISISISADTASAQIT